MGSFIVVRALIGVGEAAGPPNYNRVVANWMAPGEHGLALGITTSGSALGAALTPPLIVWIMVNFGWRAAFYIAGAVGMVVALLCYWFITNRPEEHSWVNDAELSLITPGVGPRPNHREEHTEPPGVSSSNVQICGASRRPMPPWGTLATSTFPGSTCIWSMSRASHW